MFLPPLTDENRHIASWDYRRKLIEQRIKVVGELLRLPYKLNSSLYLDADVVCLQEVSPLSFDDDFAFMKDLGYDGKEMFKKGRFRPATFWRSDRCEIIAPPVHKDRTLLTSFRRHGLSTKECANWYVLNCHLQAGPQGARRVRQINEGIRAVMTLARKQKGNDQIR